MPPQPHATGRETESLVLRVIDDAGDCVTVKREYLAALRCLARNRLTSETP